MNKIKQIIILVPIATLLGCSSGESHNSETLQKDIASFDLDKEEISAYMKLKSIPSDVGARYDRAVKVFAEQNALAAVIAKEPTINTPSFRAEIKESRNEIIIKRYFADYVNKTIDDAAIEAAYQTNIGSYTSRKARIAQIFLATPISSNAADRMSKLELAKKLAESLRNGGDFAKAALEYSDDTASKKNQGEVGWVTEGGAHQLLASIAVTMNEDNISEPIESPNGIYIIKVLEGPVTEVQPLEDVKEKLAYKLKYDAKLKEMQRLNKLASALVEH